MPVIYNYTKREYEDKIRDLENYVKTLGNLLTDLESRKKELKNFWDDAEGEKYQKTLNDNIRACKTAIFNTNTTIQELRETVSKMDNTAKAVNEAIDEAANVVSALELL